MVCLREMQASGEIPDLEIALDSSATIGENVSEAPALRLRHVPNAISAVVLFTARLIAAVLQLRIVDKTWGGGYTGLNALSNQVLLYVTLLELGLAQSAITFLYAPILNRDFRRASATVSALRHDVRRLAAFGSVVAIPGVLFYAYWIHGALPFRLVASTLLCVAVSGFIQLGAIHFQVYLNAAEQLDRVNYTLAAGYLLKTGAGLGIALATHQYLWLPVAVAALSIAEFFALKFAFHHAFPSFVSVPWLEEARRIRNRAKFATIQRIAGVAYYQSDFVILSLTTSLVTVKDYAKYQYVSAALLSVVGLVASSLTTSVARMQMRQEEHARRRQYMTAQLMICIVGSVLMFAFWFTSRAVVAIAFGADAAIDTNDIGLFGLALFLNILKSVDDVFWMAKGAFEIGWWIPIFEIPVYVVTGLVLSRSIGFTGVLIASIATNLTISIGLKGIVLARPVFDCSRVQWYGGRILNILKGLSLAAPVGLLYGLAPHILHQNLLQFVVIDLVALGYMLAAVRWLLSRARTKTSTVTVH